MMTPSIGEEEEEKGQIPQHRPINVSLHHGHLVFHNCIPRRGVDLENSDLKIICGSEAMCDPAGRPAWSGRFSSVGAQINGSLPGSLPIRRCLTPPRGLTIS